MLNRASPRSGPSAVIVVVALASLALSGDRVAGAAALTLQVGETRHVVDVVAARYAFEPAEIRVRADDLVRVRLTADDIAHSFTIDEYRISKRAAAGSTVVFEFRADREGSFRYYCNLKMDDGCREMQGLLIVGPR